MCTLTVYFDGLNEINLEVCELNQVTLNDVNYFINYEDY
jgi:hypothetical protein